MVALSTMKHFIFGYGSLICPKSRQITAPTLQDTIAEPVVIENIERTWSARVHKQSENNTNKNTNTKNSNGDRDHILGWTPMGVRFKQGAKCNGVLICVDEDELMRFDVREAGYVRHRIDLADIHPHVDSDLLINESLSLGRTSDSSEDTKELTLKGVKCDDCRLVFEKASEMRRQYSGISSEPPSLQYEDVAVWVYVQSENLPAERSFPITQSYVDIIIRGCLSISHDFARMFLETTHGWWHDGSTEQKDESISAEPASVQTKERKDANSKEVVSEKDQQSSIDSHHTWVNDRHDPMYVRADSEYSLKKGDEIDQLIGEHHKDALKRRVMSM